MRPEKVAKLVEGRGSKHGDSGWGGSGWGCTEERVVAKDPPSPPSSQFPKEGERGKWEEVSATIVFVAGHNGDGGGGGPGEVMVGGV